MIVTFNILLTLCCAILQASYSSAAADDYQDLRQLEVSDVNLHFYLQALDEISKKSKSILEVANMVEENLCSDANLKVWESYQSDLQICLSQPSDIPENFWRLMLSAHYAASPERGITLTPERLQYLKKISDRDMVFLVTKSGKPNEEDVVTLMLSGQKKYPTSLPENFETEVQDHSLRHSWSSHLLNQIGEYHSMQAQVYGPYADCFDLVFEELRILWDGALKVKEANHGDFKSVKNFLFWFVTQDHRFISEYKGDFMDDSLRKLGLRVPASAYMNPETVYMMTEHLLPEDMIDKSLEDYDIEMHKIAQIGLTHLKKCEKHPRVHAALQRIKVRLDSRFKREEPHSVAPLEDLRSCTRQEAYMQDFEGIEQVLVEMVAKYDSRVGLPVIYPHSGFIDQRCAILSEGGEKAFNMRFVVYAHLLAEIETTAFNDAWLEDIDTRLKYVCEQHNLDAISSKQKFKRYYLSEDSTEDSQWNYEEQIVSIMLTGRPLIPLDKLLQNPLRMVDLLEQFYVDGVEKMMIPLKAKVNDYVEESLKGSPESLFRQSVLKSLCAIYYPLTESLANQDPRTMHMPEERKKLMNQYAENGYLQTLCDSQRVVTDPSGLKEAERMPFTYVMNNQLYTLKREILCQLNAAKRDQS
ncbi:MAG: hypothetical protein OXC30_03260 [Alphaproteobacteria bacterium]|nr:hypothetical protein [Alphaproteobacteria bacterium]